VNTDAGVIILAGGRSRRMGTDKALLEVGRQTNIERITKEFRLLHERPILVTNDRQAYADLNVSFTGDDFPGKGPLAGVHAGLKASPYSINVVVACDMPFATVQAALVMINHVQQYDAVIPKIGGTQHPLFAVYKQSCIRQARKCLVEERLRMIDLLHDINVCTIKKKAFPPTLELEKVFFNMNRPEDYKKVQEWIGES
jgi:molybdenum cofactor guanylyltransferase